jgi:hypothetical protein
MDLCRGGIIKRDMHSALYEISDEDHKLLSTSFQLRRSAIMSISDVLVKPEH